jgi:NAD(P)-dependent dehydrogenase (short-subunit alcohol dehydrogenase family)
MSKNAGDLRTAIVTGGTGALGGAVVRAFLEAGDRAVVPWIVDAERQRAQEQHAEDVASGRLLLVNADIATEQGADAVAEAAGSVSVLVNGAGGFGGGTPVHETGLELWDSMYRINVLTAVAMTRAAVPRMPKQAGGAIVNVASRAAFDLPAGLAAYSASKSVVAVLTETLQKELAASGIRVNAVVPTTIDTPANRDAMPGADFSSWTPPEAIARVILWLASPAAASVRGGLIPV